MKNSALKLLLIVSLSLNIFSLWMIGYVQFNQPSQYTPLFGSLFNEKEKTDDYLFARLTLDHDQLKEMYRISVPYHFRRDKMRNDIAAKEKDLLTLMRQDASDRKAVNAAMSELSTMRETLQMAISNHILEISNKVDSRQRDKYFDLLDEASRKGRTPLNV
ncbi:MAG: periplasmic heavy metal sensor [Nitrospirae bacterium]|nr:periplasmic heavy metal sensor [Nitrospirota bacterium]